MSSFKKADGIIDSIQKQATGLRTLDGSAIEDFLSIAGYEKTAGGGGGGGEALIVKMDADSGKSDKTFGEVYNAIMSNQNVIYLANASDEASTGDYTLIKAFTIAEYNGEWNMSGMDGGFYAGPAYSLSELMDEHMSLGD